MSKYFGTDGFRGEAGITLTADHAYKVGRFLGWYYNALRERNGDNESARIVIGKDTRRSSYMFEYSLVAGLTASGADAYLLHVTTTPSVAYIARVDDFDCGIMISASHNPYYDNGIKLIDCYGEKMPEETLLLVENTDPELVGFEIDVHWIQRAGQDPVKWIKRLAGREDMVHLKDYRIYFPDGQPTPEIFHKEQCIQFAEIGEGNLDMKAIIEASVEGGAIYLPIEQDQTYGKDPFDCIRTSVKNICDMGFEKYL